MRKGSEKSSRKCRDQGFGAERYKSETHQGQNKACLKGLVHILHKKPKGERLFRGL